MSLVQPQVVKVLFNVILNEVFLNNFNCVCIKLISKFKKKIGHVTIFKTFYLELLNYMVKCFSMYLICTLSKAKTYIKIL